MADTPSNSTSTEPAAATRRGFFSISASLAIVSAVVAGTYASLAAMAGRFLYRDGGGNVAWQFVSTTDRLVLGESLSYTAPTGAKVVIARQAEGDSVDAFDRHAARLRPLS